MKFNSNSVSKANKLLAIRAAVEKNIEKIFPNIKGDQDYKNTRISSEQLKILIAEFLKVLSNACEQFGNSYRLYNHLDIKLLKSGGG